MRSLKILVFVLLFLCSTLFIYADVKFTEEMPTKEEYLSARTFFTNFQSKVAANDWIAVKEMIYTDDVKEGSGYCQTPKQLKDLFRANQQLISSSKLWKTKILNYSMLDDAKDIVVGPHELKRISITRKGRFANLYLEYKGKKTSKVTIRRYNPARTVSEDWPYIQLILIPVLQSSNKIIYKIFSFGITKDGTIMVDTDKC